MALYFICLSRVWYSIRRTNRVQIRIRVRIECLPEGAYLCYQNCRGSFVFRASGRRLQVFLKFSKQLVQYLSPLFCFVCPSPGSVVCDKKGCPLVARAKYGGVESVHLGRVQDRFVKKYVATQFVRTRTKAVCLYRSPRQLMINVLLAGSGRTALCPTTHVFVYAQCVYISVGLFEPRRHKEPVIRERARSPLDVLWVILCVRIQWHTSVWWVICVFCFVNEALQRLRHALPARSR